MFVWNPANPQRRSRQWWFFDLGMGATPPHTGRLIPYEGRLIRGWCHHHPKSLLKMNRNEGCLIWGWGHTWWGRAHTWWLLARPLWSCAHTPNVCLCDTAIGQWLSEHYKRPSVVLQVKDLLDGLVLTVKLQLIATVTSGRENVGLDHMLDEGLLGVCTSEGCQLAGCSHSDVLNADRLIQGLLVKSFAMALTHPCISSLQKASLSADALNSLNFSKVLGMLVSISSLMFSWPKALSMPWTWKWATPFQASYEGEALLPTASSSPSLEEMRADDTCLSAQRYLTCFTKELRIKVGGELQVFFASGHLNDVGDMRLIYSVLCHSHHIKAEANRLLGLVPYFLEDLGHHILVGLSRSTLMPSRSHGSFQLFLQSSLWMARCTSSWETSRKKGFSASPQNMLERGGLPSGLHANESHHAILAKTSVDGWEVKV